MELLDALGLNLKVLLAQLINFAILLFILWKFGYRPILNILAKRRKKVSQGVKDAQAAEEKLNAARGKEKEVISQAKKEALVILEEAKYKAEDKKRVILDKAKEEIGEVINHEKQKIQQEKAETLKSIKADVSQLVILAVEKVLQEKIDTKKDKDLVAQAIKGLK